MTADSYIEGIVNKYSLASGQGSPGHNLAPGLVNTIRNWAGSSLIEVYFAGSYQKGTGIRGVADLDLFISLRPETSGNMSELYWGLFHFLKKGSLSVNQQDVSIGLTYGDFHVNLIPARKQSGNTDDHVIYSTRRGSWIQTNVWEHINLVKNSGRIDEIKATKIWKRCHNLNFPSFYLELSLLRALSGRARNQISDNIRTVLLYLRDSFSNARIVDPANSNNTVSDDLTANEKSVIAKTAATSLTKGSWMEILW